MTAPPLAPPVADAPAASPPAVTASPPLPPAPDSPELLQAAKHEQKTMLTNGRNMLRPYTTTRDCQHLGRPCAIVYGQRSCATPERRALQRNVACASAIKLAGQ